MDGYTHLRRAYLDVVENGDGVAAERMDEMTEAVKDLED